MQDIQGQSQEQSPEQNLSKLEDSVTAVISNADGQNGFFCTDEQFVTKFDDREIIKYVQMRFPDFGIAPGCQAFKQAVFDFLEDEKFVRHVMQRFEFEPCDLFKFLFRMDPAVFKGMFMKRVKEIV